MIISLGRDGNGNYLQATLLITPY